MSNPRIDELLQQCTVKLSVSENGQIGTGFLIAPSYILTCEHVVRGATTATVGYRNNHDYATATVEQIFADKDVALLRFEPLDDLPCVSLSTDVPEVGGKISTFGYPYRYDNDGTPWKGIPALLTMEGTTGDEPSYLQLSLGNVLPGMSGGPLLDRATGQVCGMLKFTRDEHSVMGGGGVLGSTIAGCIPEVLAAQQQFHERDGRWREALLKKGQVLPNLNISNSVLETVQIGGIAGRDLNLTKVQGSVGAINVFGSVQVEQAPTSTATTLSKQEYRWRQTLLGKVKQFWIEGVLEKSLHTRIVFELGLEERSNLVQKPLSGIEEFSEDEGQAFPEGTTASKVFEDIGAGRTLLILGEPGSGKTVTLLKLAQSLIMRAENDFSQPLPVVMNLSSWAKQRKSIADWLVQELNNVYGANKALGKAWVEQEQLILLLDGLDEVDTQYRDACVKALNQFIETHGLTEIVVCSRIRDYEALSECLKLRSAIYVRPLTNQQVEQFLDSAGKSLVVLKKAIKQNTELQKLASSPLMLSIVSLAYQDCSAEALPWAGTAESQRKQLLDTYIDRMLMRRGTTKQYSAEQMLHWLTFLSKRMVQLSQSIFLIERMQPSWLQDRVQRIRWRLESGLIIGLFTGLFVGLFSSRFFGPIDSLSFGLVSGLLFELSIFFLTGDIKPVESLRCSWKGARTFLHQGLIYGLLPGLIYGLFFRSDLDVKHVLCVVLISGLVGASIGLRGPEMEKRFNPNEGIGKSTQYALVCALFFSLIAGLLSKLTSGPNVGLLVGVFSGLTAGLSIGGSASIRHFTLRLMLYRMGHIPWNYARFLDHAADRLFLQKVGGGYIFIHRTLLEHFAQMEYPSQGQ